jgi:hypothetical protein
MLCIGWMCGGVKILPLLGGFACMVCLQNLSKISLQEARYLLLPSSCHLGISGPILKETKHTPLKIFLDLINTLVRVVGLKTNIQKSVYFLSIINLQTENDIRKQLHSQLLQKLNI